MNRNVESHFSQIPQIDIQRSIFDRGSSHKTSFNVGDVIPIYLDEVLPGDTFRMTTSKVVRLQTMLTPIMDNMYLDTYWFFVPNRLIWDHWREFCGENTASAWAPSVEYSIPKITSPDNGFASGTIADYMGIPVGVEFQGDVILPSALPFRAYALIMNEFFRDENLSDPLNIPTGDSNQTGSNGDSYISDVANGGMPFKAAKYHDYFTSCLPQPQKGDSPLIPVGGNPFPGGTFPVVSYAVDEETYEVPYDSFSHANNLKFFTGLADGRSGSSNVGEFYWPANGDVTAGRIQVESANYTGWPANLQVTIPGVEPSPIESLSINDLRIAFAAQRFLERNARGGTRYIELLKSHFGVTSPDARLQRPEYLGGNRIPLQVHQVTNAAQSEQDFLGDLGAMSVTSDIHSDFDKSFTEHGYLLGLCVCRYDHTYSQGLDRLWTRSIFEDFYLPVFANLGEQPVFQRELFYTGDADEDDVVFGYQEAWAEYRYKPNRVSGEMRPGIPNTLASWHLADLYTDPPTLSDEWIREDKTNVDRALAVTSSVSNQIFADFYFSCVCTRPMPMYSVPGLLDHN